MARAARKAEGWYKAPTRPDDEAMTTADELVRDLRLRALGTLTAPIDAGDVVAAILALQDEVVAARKERDEAIELASDAEAAREAQREAEQREAKMERALTDCEHHRAAIGTDRDYWKAQALQAGAALESRPLVAPSVRESLDGARTALAELRTCIERAREALKG